VNLSEFLIAAVIATFANCAVIEAVHHGEIFARVRAWFEAREGFLSELVGCPFCFSYWTSLPLLLLCLWHVLTLYQLPALIPLALAVTRMSNLLNDVLHAWCRTPRVAEEIQNEIASLDLLTQGGDDAPVTDGGNKQT
jgi:hypothetical protein